MVKITENDLILRSEKKDSKITKINEIFAYMRMAQEFLNDAKRNRLAKVSFKNNLELSQSFFDKAVKLIQDEDYEEAYQEGYEDGEVDAIENYEPDYDESRD